MGHRIIGTAARIGSAALFALLIGGCASSDHQPATHRWVSTNQSTDNQYRADNSACMRSTMGTAGQRVFDTSAPEYWQYVSCMNARGYSLTAADVATTR